MSEHTVRVPGDKSLTHRALIFAALATGRSTITRPLVGADTMSTAACLRACGVDVPALDTVEAISIDGLGLHGLREPGSPLDCGNSGTTARLLLGVLAGYPFPAKLTGDASLSARPMRRVTEPLARMGARFTEHGASDRLPVTVQGGGLSAIEHESPHASAQVKSALLLAGLTGGVHVSVTEPILSRDHTERMLARMGVALQRETLPDGRVRVSLADVHALDAFEFEVPGDFSSAAFVVALACLRRKGELRVDGVGLNPTRTGFLDVVRRMGASVEVVNARESCGEPIGDLVAVPARLRAVHIGGAEVPSLIDEIPVIAALAARADGVTRIEGAGELRVKESDRITAVVENLRAVGVHAEELPDGMVIHGSDAPLQGAVRTLHDHRIAMAFGVLAESHDTEIHFDHPDVVSVSFPGFWTMMKQLSDVRGAP